MPLGEVAPLDRIKLRVISENEAAAILGLSYCTLRRMRLDDIGPPFVRLGARRIGYRLSSLDAWLDGQERNQVIPSNDSRSSSSRSGSSARPRKMSHRPGGTAPVPRAKAA